MTGIPDPIPTTMPPPPPIPDYEAETILAIRQRNTRLNVLHDSTLRDLYRTWSTESACAGWLAPSDTSITLFVEWALTAPADRPCSQAGEPLTHVLPSNALRSG